jgi:hypothetical protein
MNKKLERFIAENREEFDTEMPGNRVWEQIDQQMSEQKKNPFQRKPLFYWAVAASILALMVLGIYFSMNKPMSPQPALSGPVPQTDVQGANMMNEFTKLIVMKQQELKQFSTDQPELYRKFTKDIRQLDSTYNTLKTQIDVTPNREMLIEAMIQNLQLQLNVLNQQLHIIQQIKSSKNEDHEKNKQTI